MSGSYLLKFDSSVTTQTSHDFTVNYNNFILDREADYEIALVKANIWYSYYNIAEAHGNNKFRYHNGTVWRNQVIIPDGVYSVDQINDIIQGNMYAHGDYTSGSPDSYDINLYPNYSTLKLDIVLTNNYQLDLQDSQSTLNALLGFSSSIPASNGLEITVTGDRTVDITRGVNSLSIHCSLVQGSYENEVASDVIYSFSPDKSPGELLNIDVNQRIYLPIRDKGQITSIRFRLTDQKDRPVDLNNEDCVYLCELRKIK
jgi:hypothetical protein